jgi:hypothetical protein
MKTRKFRSLTTGVVLSALAFASACQSDRTIDFATFPYTPRTLANLDGAVEVYSFRYAKRTDVMDNEIYIPMIIRTFLDQPVGDFVANAIRREFRQAGITARDADCVLVGEVKNLSVSYTIVNSTYEAEIQYVLEKRDNRRLLDKTYFSSVLTYETHAIDDLFAKHLYSTLAQNIGQLMTDQNFQAALAEGCPVVRNRR